MDEFNTSVETQEVAEPVINEQAAETTESVNAEVTTAQENEKPVQQSQEENAKYASIRREYEAKIAAESQKAIDAEYSRLYGESHGIHSKSDYDLAVKRAEEEAKQEELRSQGIDPETFNKYIEDNPVVKQAKTLIEQQNQQRYLSGQVKALEAYAPGIDLSKLNPNVVKDFELGKPLVDAYMKWETVELKAKLAEYESKLKAQETNQVNAQSSTGSLTGNGVADTGFISFENFEANKGDQRWVMKNLNKIQESRVKW